MKVTISIFLLNRLKAFCFNFQAILETVVCGSEKLYCLVNNTYFIDLNG